MKRHLRIENKLYNDIWCIVPSNHAAMCKQYEAHIKGIKADWEDGDDDEEDPEDNTDAPENNFGTDTALISIDGDIGKHLSMLETLCGGVDLDDVNSQLIEARDNPAIQKIAIYFNTPGGLVTGVSETADLIKSVAQVKPVIGYADCLCCSAGMWLASVCSQFFCAGSSRVGSVNVFSLYMDESQALAKAGVAVNAITGSM